MKHAHAVLLVLVCTAMCAAFGCGPPRPNYSIFYINRMSKSIGRVELTHTDGSYFSAGAPGGMHGEGGSCFHMAISDELPEEALLKWTDVEGVPRQRILKLRDFVVGKLDLTDGNSEINVYFNEDGTISVGLIRVNRRSMNHDDDETIIEYTQDEISYPAP